MGSFFVLEIIYNLNMKKIYISYLLFVSVFINSQEVVDEAIDTQVKASSESVELQLQINELDDVSKKIYFEYKDTLNEYKSLKNFDDQLSKIIDEQIKEIANINEQIDSLDSINIDILPLLKRMVDSLEKFISYDIPFLLDERTSRVEQLDDLLDRADITTAEKFRKIFEAYQIEADFGRTIESYDSYLQIDGEEKAVQLFRLGRLGLFYRTLDGRDTGYWDVVNNNWLDQGSKLDANIKAAIDVANRQTPPNFISLPLKPVSSND